jgi:PEP-CTERM motif
LKYSRSQRNRRHGRRSHRTRRTSAWLGATVRALAFLSLVAICVVGIHWISRGAHEYAEHWNRPASPSQSLSSLAGPHVGEIQARNQRVVYPYSVVPGGVGSPQELRSVAARDQTVAEHYAGFDYEHARVVPVSQPRMVYVSYRRRNKVYWTRKQMSLHPGEKLLTDGKITARTRCGNQVSVLPQANTSADEPLMAELDRPDAVASGIMRFPGNLSSLLSADPVMPAGPSSIGGGNSFAGGGVPPTSFIPLPVGAPIPPPVGSPITSGCTQTGTNCNPPPPPPPPPPSEPSPSTVPEPGSVILMMTGAAAALARFRGKRK